MYEYKLFINIINKANKYVEKLWFGYLLKLSLYYELFCLIRIPNVYKRNLIVIIYYYF